MVKRKRIFLFGLFFLIAALLVCAGVWWYALNSSAVSYQIIERGGKNALASGGNLYLVSGKPGILFGTEIRPGAPEELSYVLVFRHALTANDLTGLGPPHELGIRSEGRKQESFGWIKIKDKRIDVRFEAEWNETYKNVIREALEVGGKSKDLASGKVFLVHLAGQEPVYVQKNPKLKMPVAPLETPEDVERLAGEIIKILEEEDSETKAFIR